VNFTNAIWRTAAILKTVKLPYLCNRSTDFDEIWHGDANCPPDSGQTVKIWNFGGRHLENHKNRDIYATV